MSYHLLIADPDEPEARRATGVLTSAGYTVRVVGGFEPALEALSKPFDLLIAAIRLGAFNGLHLVMRSRVMYPEMPAIVLGVEGDSLGDAELFGVPFLAKPLERTRLLRAVATQLEGRVPLAAASERRWPRKSAHLPAIVADAAVRVIDLSYGGVRLEGPAFPAGVGEPVALTFPTLGMSLTAVPRWVKPAAEGAAWCGAEILDTGVHVTEQWRGFVDSMH